MAEETTRDFLARREHELRSRIAALRGQIAPLEAELVQVQQMSAMMPQPDPKPLSDLAKLLASQTIAGGAGAAALTSPLSSLYAGGTAVNALVAGNLNPRETIAGSAVNALAEAAANPFAVQNNPYATRTIKDLVIQALLDGFTYGATAADLRSFILKGYGRTVDPGSLRTQLHRLKASGILGQDPASDSWNFKEGKRALYAMYDHPTSRRDMKELQDDPTTNPSVEELLDGTSKMPWEQGGHK